MPTDIVYVAKKELLEVPILRTFVKKLNCIMVDRLDFIKSLSVKKQVVESVQHGNSILIFPEATFTDKPGLLPFKLGAFITAVETKTPICSIAIQGTRAILRGTRYLAKPGTIRISIKGLITPKSDEWSEVIRLQSLVRNEIAKECGESLLSGLY
jgi:1-acyl-sn-glycerol-3-phosphate acyltransferase